MNTPNRIFHRPRPEVRRLRTRRALPRLRFFLAAIRDSTP